MSEEKLQRDNFGCHEFETRLAEYLEGEESPGVRVHADQCPSCGALLDDLELIQAASKALPLESPSPRVWSNIRATLVEEGYIREHESFWRRWIAALSRTPRTAPAAALTFALILAVIVVFKGDLHRNGTQIPASTPPAAENVVPVGLSGVQTNLARTVQAMEENYKAREASLDPSAKQIYEAGLTSLDNSIQECLASLQKQPHNMLVREYLMQAYAQKAEVLASALEEGGR